MPDATSMPTSPPATPDANRDPQAPVTDGQAQLHLILGIADRLVPLFRGAGNSPELSRRMVDNAIAAYCPESCADFVNIARTIACSMASLLLVGDAAAPDLPLRDKMRLLGRVITLNRCAEQSERTMMRRRRDQQASAARAAKQHQASPPARPAMPMSDDEIDRAVDDAVEKFLAPLASAPAKGKTPAAALTTPPAEKSPVAATPTKPVAPPPNAQLAQKIKAAVVPVQTAIHHGGQASSAGRRQQASYKQKLLHRTAIQQTLPQPPSTLG